MENNQTIKWSEYEYIYKEKSADWYWAVGIIGMAITLTAFIFSNALFAIFIVIGSFTLMMYGSKKPKKIEFVIDGRGIVIGKELFPFSSLKSFGIIEKEDENKLIVQSEKMLMPYINIPLGDNNPEMIRDFLLDHLEEEDHQESLSEIVMGYLGF